MAPFTLHRKQLVSLSTKSPQCSIRIRRASVFGTFTYCSIFPTSSNSFQVCMMVAICAPYMGVQLVGDVAALYV